MAEVITPVVRAETWLKTHERLIIVALVLAVGAFGLNKYFDVSAARKDAKAVAAEQVAADAKANAAAAAVTAAQTQAQYLALVQAIAAQNTALNASMAQRTASQTAQQAKNATLSITGVADRWNVIAGTLVTASGDTIVVSNTDAHKTLNLLESVPILTANLADETKIAQNTQQELEKSDVLAGGLNNEIAALNNQLTADAKACTLNIAAVKADARKGKAKWFKIGFVTGLVTGIFAGHAAGI